LRQSRAASTRRHRRSGCRTAHDGARHPAAGVAGDAAQHRQHVSSACSRYDAGFVVGIFDFLRTIEAARVDPKWAHAEHERQRLRRCRAILLSSAATACRATLETSSCAWRAEGAEGTLMDNRPGEPRADAVKTSWRSRSSPCTKWYWRFPRFARHQSDGRGAASVSSSAVPRAAASRPCFAASIGWKTGSAADRRRRHRADRRSKHIVAVRRDVGMVFSISIYSRI